MSILKLSLLAAIAPLCWGAFYIAAFKFGYRDIGCGEEPCVELINQDCQVCLRFYYRGGDAVQKYRQFVERHRRYENLFAGEW